MRLAPVLRARVYTSIHAPSAPRKAATGTAVIEVGIKAAQRTAPRPAPGIHPDDIGPRQGVAQHSLDDDPAHRQGTAAQQGRQGAGQAGIDHDIVCLGLTAHQGGQDL